MLFMYGVSVLLFCCIFPLHAMDDDQQNHEGQREKTAWCLNNEELRKIFGKPVSELHNQCAKEKAMYATLLSRIRSHEQYKNFNANPEAVFSELIGQAAAHFNKSMLLHNHLTEPLHFPPEMVLEVMAYQAMILETVAYSAVNQLLKSALEDITKDSK